MPLRVKTARLHQSVTFLKGCAVVIAPIASVVLVHQLFPRWDLGNVIGGTVMALTLALVLYFGRNASRLHGHRFTCPDCKAAIAQPLENSGANREPILISNPVSSGRAGRSPAGMTARSS